MAAAGCSICGTGARLLVAGERCLPVAGGVVGADLPALPSAADELRGELCPLVGAADRPIMEYLVASLDGHGRLDAEPAEVGDALGVEPSRVVRVLGVLQASGFPWRRSNT